MNINLRLLYLYLFSFIGLLTLVIGSIQLVDLGLKMTLFQEADRYDFYPEKLPGDEDVDQEERALKQEKEVSRQRQRQLSNTLAMITVGLPLYAYHWKTIQKETKK